MNNKCKISSTDPAPSSSEIVPDHLRQPRPGDDSAKRFEERWTGKPVSQLLRCTQARHQSCPSKIIFKVNFFTFKVI